MTTSGEIGDPDGSSSPGENDTPSPGENDTPSPGENDTPSPGEIDTPSPGEIDTLIVALTRSLLDVLPDDVLTFIRGAVVRGDRDEATLALAFALLRSHTPVTDAEAAALADCLALTGGAPELITDLAASATGRPAVFDVFAYPEVHERSTGTGTDAPLEPSDWGAEADSAVLARVAIAIPGVVGVWRAWLLPATDTPWPPPRPVYLVETSSPEALTDVLARAYGDTPLCTDARDPLVEAYVTGDPLPALHRGVQQEGELVHTAEVERPFQFADLFEGEPGPDGQPPEMPTVGDDDADRILAYLASVPRLMVASNPADDLLDRDRIGVVPLDLRTDGEWVWADATAYYLAEHRMAPSADFLAYLEQRPDTTAPLVSDTRRHQAVVWLSSI
ncbi:MAG: hypothetical protein ACRCYX_14375 [Dermatophilaceae bacterium]